MSVNLSIADKILEDFANHMTEFRNLHYTYETKCRRCGRICEWSFAPKKGVPWFQFQESMRSRIDHPVTYYCASCSYETVQDVISYSSKEA